MTIFETKRLYGNYGLKYKMLSYFYSINTLAHRIDTRDRLNIDKNNL